MLSNLNRSSMNTISNNTLNTLKQNFVNFKQEEPIRTKQMNSSDSFFEIRSNMTSWLNFLCQKLNFNPKTLFRSITIFDLYLTKLIKKNEKLSQNKLNLITIACLSLSTKMEEINCNYISFLNEKVLNNPKEQIYTNKDLTKMEFQILKELNYKILYTTPIDFLEIYIEIFKNIMGNNNEKFFDNIKNLSINIMINNINNEMFINNTYSCFAYFSFIQVLTHLNILVPLIALEMEKIIFAFNCQSINGNKNENEEMKNQLISDIVAFSSL